MIRDLGIVRPGTTLYIPFHTFSSDDPSASMTITGLATTDIEVYKNGGTTQRASDAGYALLDTDGIDFDATTGIHGISIDLADNTTADFYTAGAQYWVVIASITLDAATINFIPVTFTIGYPDALINTTIATLASQTSFTLTAGPAEDDALNGMWCIIHDIASAVQLGYGIISDYTGATKTVTLAAGTTFTAAAGDNISLMGPMPLQPATAGRTIGVESDGDLTKVNTLDGHTAQTGDTYGALPTNFSDLSVTVTTGRVDVASVAGTAQTANDNGADINAILTDTGTTLETHLTDIKGGTFSGATDSLEAIRDRGDAAWTTGSGTGLSSLATGTAQAGAAGTITLAAGATATDNLYNGARIATTGGTGAGQSRMITDYNGTTKVATIAPNWTTNPGADTTYEIQAADSSLGTIQNDAQSVTDLKDFADAGYDPATNKVQGVVLTDTTTTNTDMRGTDNAALASVLGALTDAAAAGDPTTADTVMQYIKQLINVLIGTAGIGTFPAEAAPANAVSLAEVIRAIHADVTGLNGDAMRGTDSAALASVCTEARLAELAAANLPTDIANLNNISAADVNAQVSDVIKTDTYTLPGQEAPSATPTLEGAILYLYKFLRNKIETTATAISIYDDAGTTVDQKSTISDDGTTFSRGEFGSGP